MAANDFGTGYSGHAMTDTATRHDRRRKVLAVFGTRPEAIKMMPVVQELRARPSIAATVVVTGQHRTMLDQVFAAFAAKPDVDLGLMTHNQSLAQITAGVLTEMSRVYAEHTPDLVLVHGDTTTAMAAALAAFYAKIPLGHVEAGLRSFDPMSPWPEEFNRVAIDGVADHLFAPTEVAAENLRQAHNRRGKIAITGNTGIDALLQTSRRIDADRGFGDGIARRYAYLDPAKRLVLVTGHRRESFGGGFERICDGLAAIAARGDTEILYPVHLNPNVKSVVGERLGGTRNIRLIDPVEYGDMVYLMKRAAVLLTDSGGIQEEGPALGRPVLVMREVTERPEAVAIGAARLVGTDPLKIRAEVDLLLDNAAEYVKRSKAVFPYGDGTAARQIVDIIESEPV